MNIKPRPTSGANQWWPKRLGRRLALGFGALVTLMLIALMQAAVPLKLVGEGAERFATQDMQRLLRVQALSLQIEGVGVSFIRLLNAPRDTRVAEYADVDEQNRRIDGIIATLGHDLADAQQQETLKRLVACRAIYADAFIATVDELEGDNPTAAARALTEQVNPALKAMLVESNALLSRERQLVEDQLANAQAMLRRIVWLMAAISALVVAIAAWLGWRTTRSVVTPLARLESGAKDIAAGNYGHLIEATGLQEVDRVGEALNTMADTVSQRERQISRQAFEDSLTGLPNRAALLQPGQAGKARHNTLALLDLARLKVVNETLGYTTGDSLILALAERARTVVASATADGLVSPEAVLARLAGGTFAIWFGTSSRHNAQALLAQLEHVVQAPVTCSGQLVDLNLVVGFADFGEAGAEQPVETLLRNAEIALHAAKRSAQTHAWYSEAQEAARVGHLGLVTDLRAAVADNQLQMWLQPKFSLATGQAIGAEALVRWQHPVRGFVSPAEFVPFAEQTGHITLVTQWMLQQALATLSSWATLYPHLSIAVNVSTRDLQDPGFALRVKDMVCASGINPKRLRLEITESGLMDDTRRSIALLHALCDIGLPLSIDDFGTGYSSLAYLQQMPVTELKIDRSFIDKVDASPGTQRLVHAMVEMGHGLGLMVTAEGVETEAEKATITRLGCDVMQGYLGSRPLHGKALQDWLDHLPPPSPAPA